MTGVHISIVVFQESPPAETDYRHTMLWLDFPNIVPGWFRAHVVNRGSGLLKFEWEQTRDPLLSNRNPKEITVGTLSLVTTPDEMRSLLEREIPINNDDKEFDCQKWVGYALEHFRDAGYLSAEAYEEGMKGMITAITDHDPTEDDSNGDD